MNYAYLFFIGDLLLPIAPESLEHDYRSTTKTTVSIEKGEYLLTNKKGLIEYSFEICLPQSKDIGYNLGWGSLAKLPYKLPYIGNVLSRITHTAMYYLERLTYYKDSQTPFTFTVVRSPTQQRLLFETCVDCVLDSMKIKEGAKTNNILMIELTLIEYRSIQIQKYNLTNNEIRMISESRPQTTWYDMNNVSSFYNCGVNILENEYHKRINSAKNFLDNATKEARGSLNKSISNFLSEPVVNGIKKVAWLGLKLAVTYTCPLLGALI